MEKTSSAEDRYCFSVDLYRAALQQQFIEQRRLTEVIEQQKFIEIVTEQGICGNRETFGSDSRIPSKSDLLKKVPNFLVLLEVGVSQ